MFQTSIRLEDVTINPEYEAMVPPLTDEEYTRLRDSIKESGLYEKITINKDHVILDGHHRFKACKETGVIPRFEVKVFDSDIDEAVYVIETNVIRRQLNDYQKTRMGMTLTSLYSRQAKQRQRDKTLPPNLEEVNEWKRETDARVAKAVGLGKTTYQNAKKILEMGSPKQIEAFKKGLRTINGVYKDIKRVQEIEEIRSKIPSIIPPEGPFDVIVIDPPWMYGGKYDADHFMGRVASPYPEMSLDDIKKIKLPLQDDAVVWLWTTNGFLHEAYHVLDAWGLEPKAVLTWVKNNLGIGYWLRNKTEHCILAIKGNPKIHLTNQSTVLIADNIGHSIKPDEFYDLVDSLCVGIKLDWFSRTNREGWVTYGTMERSE